MGLSEEITYAYAGKRYDRGAGLFYLGKRYYDPTLRRWLAPIRLDLPIIQIYISISLIALMYTKIIMGSLLLQFLLEIL